MNLALFRYEVWFFEGFVVSELGCVETNMIFDMSNIRFMLFHRKTRETERERESQKNHKLIA